MRVRQLVVGAPEVVEQLLVGGRLLERVELGPVQVLQQRVAQQGVVGRLADDRRDGLEPGLLRRPASAARPSPARTAVADGADDDRLQQADLADRVRPARPSRPRRRPCAAGAGWARSRRRGSPAKSGARSIAAPAGAARVVGDAPGQRRRAAAPCGIASPRPAAQAASLRRLRHRDLLHLDAASSRAASR